MKLTMIEDAYNFRVEFSHPDYGTEVHFVSVGHDCSHMLISDEECAEFNKELFKMLREKYDRYHFYHNMEVYSYFDIDGKHYEVEVKDLSEE